MAAVIRRERRGCCCRRRRRADSIFLIVEAGERGQRTYQVGRPPHPGARWHRIPGMGLIITRLIIWLVLSILGFVVKGLVWLAIITAWCFFRRHGRLGLAETKI